MDKAAVSPLTSSFDQGQEDSGKEEGEAWPVGIGVMWALGGQFWTVPSRWCLSLRPEAGVCLYRCLARVHVSMYVH